MSIAIQQVVDAEELALQFIRHHRAGALATCGGDGTPHVATVYCVIDDDFSIFFSTRAESRKYDDVIQNNVVAMAFSDETSMSTVQLTGTAERVQELKLEQDVYYRLSKLRYGESSWRLPPLSLFERGASGEIAVFKIQPFEMTFANFTVGRIGHHKPFFQTII